MPLFSYMPLFFSRERYFFSLCVRRGLRSGLAHGNGRPHTCSTRYMLTRSACLYGNDDREARYHVFFRITQYIGDTHNALTIIPMNTCTQILPLGAYSKTVPANRVSPRWLETRMLFFSC
jgi:hypothetical protein